MRHRSRQRGGTDSLGRSSQVGRGRHPESEPPSLTITGVCRIGSKALVRPLWDDLYRASRRGLEPWVAGGHAACTRRSFIRAASGSGSPELFPEDALPGEADIARDRQIAICGHRSDANRGSTWAGAEKGACESIILREREEARAIGCAHT